MTRKSSISVQIGNISGSTFAIGDGATVVNGQVVSGDDENEDDE
jgi:hypothetical protein